MKQIIILFILFQTIINTSHAQNDNNAIPKWILEANTSFRFTPNGNTVGLIMAVDKPFWYNSKNNLSLDLGLQGTFTLGIEGGFEETYGTTTNSGIHLVFGPTIYLLKSERLIVKPCVYSGWSYKSTDMGIDNEELNIHQSYTDSYNYLARGLFIQTGYAFNQGFVLTAYIKADLRRLTDGDGILEYPDLLYGIGIAKKINCR